MQVINFFFLNNNTQVFTIKLYTPAGKSSIKQTKNKAFRRVETLFVQGRSLASSRPAIGWRKVNKPRQAIAVMLGTSFLPWTNTVTTCRKALLCTPTASLTEEVPPSTRDLFVQDYVVQDYLIIIHLLSKDYLFV